MKDDEVILVGSGGHALSLAEFASWRIKGYLSNEENPEMPGKWLGNDYDAGEYIKLGHKFHIAYVYSGLPIMLRRRELIENYERLGASFASIISPTAIVTNASSIGDGSAIMTGSIINRAKLETHVIVNSGAIIEHDCHIGANTFIGPGAVIGGFTHIGSNCFIGLGAKIGNGLHIGDNISVAMGAVVTKNLTEPGIYHGTPLRHFKIPGTSLKS